MLRRAFSDVVTLTAFPWEGGVTKVGPSVYVPSDRRQDRLGIDLDRIAPYLFFDEYFRSPEGQSQISGALRNQCFDVCIVEQPFMGRAMVDFFEANCRTMPKFVYSSQNIESAMLSGILRDAQDISEAQASSWTRAMQSLETDFARRADWCLAVSKKDGKSLERFGARGWTLLPNGAEIRPPSSRALKEVAKLLRGSKYLLFVASGHPPNVEGFRKMIGRDGTFLRPDTRVVVAGSASLPIKDDLVSSETESLSSRALLLGEIPEDSLSALIFQATGILVPIVSGGGSNLKTAEALVSGKSTIATEFAFRGFEEYANLPRVHLSNGSSEFQRNMRSVLDLADSEPGVSASFSEEPPMPTWENCLSNLPDLLSDLKAR